MTPLEIIQEHHRLCDEVHQCALKENRFLRLHQRAPDQEFLTHKAALLEQLDRGLAALRALPAIAERDVATTQELEQTRARILQILQLDQENEQLLLRCSLNAKRTPPPAGAPTPAGTLLQKIYARCS